MVLHALPTAFVRNGASPAQKGPHRRSNGGVHSGADLGDGAERGREALHARSDGVLGGLDASCDSVACLGHCLVNRGGGRKGRECVQDRLHVLGGEAAAVDLR